MLPKLLILLKLRIPRPGSARVTFEVSRIFEGMILLMLIVNVPLLLFWEVPSIPTRGEHDGVRP